MVIILDTNGKQINKKCESQKLETPNLLNDVPKNRIKRLSKRGSQQPETNFSLYRDFSPHYLLGLSIEDLGKETGIEELNGVGLEFAQAVIYTADIRSWSQSAGFLCRFHYAKGLKGLLEGEFEKKTSSSEFLFNSEEILEEHFEDSKTWESLLETKHMFVQDFLLRGISDKGNKIVDACYIKVTMFLKRECLVNLEVEVTPIKNKDSVGDIKAGTYSFSKRSALIYGPEQPYGRAHFGSCGILESSLGENSDKNIGFSIEKLEDFPEDKKEHFPDNWRK